MNKLNRFLLNKVTQITPEKIRVYVYKIFGMNIGRGTVIRQGCFFDQNRISIGENCFINKNCQFHMGGEEKGKIAIGNNVRFGMDVELICVSHLIGDEKQRAAEDTYEPIIINDGCWICARVTILEGVDIGKGTIIAAGSLVNKDCEPNSLYAGIPARMIKKLDKKGKKYENL